MNDKQRIRELEAALLTIIEAAENPALYLEHNYKVLSEPVKAAKLLLGISTTLSTEIRAVG